MTILDRNHPAVQLMQVKSNETALFIPTKINEAHTALVLNKGMEALLHVRPEASKTLQLQQRYRFVLVTGLCGDIALVHYATGLKMATLACSYPDLDVAQRCMDSLVSQHGLEIVMRSMDDAPVVNA